MATVVTDADACIPRALLDGLPLAVAPPDAPLLLQPESVPRLRLEVAPPDPGPVANACALAAAGGRPVLYIATGDGYGSSEAVIERAREATEGSGDAEAFLLHDSGAALMGCGWQAVAAARALAAGADAALARDAAAMVAARVQVLAALEHPEFAGAGGFDEARRTRLRVVAALRGEQVEPLDQVPQRERALVLLRDRFRAAAGRNGGALHVAVHHAAAAPGAEALATWIRRELDPAELAVAPLTRHAATRLGPRMLAVAWYRDPA